MSVVDTTAFHLYGRTRKRARTGVDVEMSSNKQLSFHFIYLRTQDIRWQHANPHTMEQEGNVAGKGEQNEKRNGRNVRVVRSSSSTSRIVDITETKDRAKDEHDK